MNYLEEALARARVQQICEFLIYGVEGEKNCENAMVRAENAKTLLYAALRKAGVAENEELESAIFCYAGTCESVYMELGIKAGARMIMELLR